MTHLKNIVLALIVGAFFSFNVFATDQEQQQSLELEKADVAVLQLATVEKEADENSNEVHQEATVGRAGLAGACRCFPDGNGGLICQ